MSMSDTFSRPIDRRRFLQTAAATVGTASLGNLLAACGGGPTSSKTVILQYWDGFVSQAPWIDQEIQLFQQAHPGIKIKKRTQAGNTFDNIYALAVRSGKAPDVSTIPGPDPFPVQVQKHWYREG